MKKPNKNREAFRQKKAEQKAAKNALIELEVIQEKHE